MTDPSFETFTLERHMTAPVARVFGAFADPEARAIWAPPSPDFNMAYSEADFREGGRDVSRCGPGPAEGVSVETLYHVIQEDRLLHFTEVLRAGSEALGSALVTVVMVPQGASTDLRVTLQATGLADPATGTEMRGGWNASLTNLQAWLQRQ